MGWGCLVICFVIKQVTSSLRTVQVSIKRSHIRDSRKAFRTPLFYLSELNNSFGFGMYNCHVLSWRYHKIPCLQWEQKGKVADSMMVTSVLMLSYLLKFFWWEGGYLNTLNMMYDRGKHFFCWITFNDNKSMRTSWKHEWNNLMCMLPRSMGKLAQWIYAGRPGMPFSAVWFW
jgi:hypothetical protein